MSQIEQNRGVPKGLVHLYVGDGKGKTTAAVGLAVRAAGHGRRVVFCQFLKGRPSGEITSLQALGIRVIRPKSTGKFLHQMSSGEREQEAKNHQLCLMQIKELLAGGQVDLAVFDEAVDAQRCGLLPEGSLEELAGCGGAELVFTGRNPSPELQALADYHTDFVCRSHPYRRGVSARRGIEY